MKKLSAILLAVALPGVAFASVVNDTKASDLKVTSSHAPSMGTSAYQPGTLPGSFIQDPTKNTAQIVDGSSGTIIKTGPGIASEATAAGVNSSTVLDSNSKITIADRDLTRNITQNLLSRPEFSESMSNVKVGSFGGRVTLQGTVGSINEKRRFTDQVEKMVGVDSVDNQLMVKI